MNISRFHRYTVVLATALIGLCAPHLAQAKVAEANTRGFVVRHMVEIPSGVDKTWETVLDPAEWWDSAHTWSGDAANLSIDPRAGGCFCELLPHDASPRAAPKGSVEHMRVVYIERPRLLRMTGALGPLQSEAVNGTLTIQLKPRGGEGQDTVLLLEYVVGGYMRQPVEAMAGSVDAMLGAQLERLTSELGGAFARAFPGGDLGLDPVPDTDAKENADAEEAPDGVEPLAPEPPEGEVIER
ncbi:SRPBCC family protein [Novosphingobium profundi]|uniref:SRPBCC family protein n=1 Tax=Novosphingobium profundi TaxID=1774954 RepID=UPI001CFEBE8D|nr:SRPBCC family protein [Novosphingobium profundi]